MTLKENNEFTNKAWNRLYDKLEHDGLLAETIPEKLNVRSASTNSFIKWGIMAAAVLCICVFSIVLFNGLNAVQSEDILVLNNEKNAPTLVSTLEDGSIVYLSQQTSLLYPSHFSDNKREVSLAGNAFFDVSKDQNKPFIIETKQIKIEVLGTSFNVKSRDNESFSLSVRHGKVRVISKKDGQTIIVNAGETALFDSGNLWKSQTTDVDQFSSYLKQIHFKDQALFNVVEMINQNSDTVQLELTPGVANRLLTVSFSNDTPYTMAQLICLALDLRFEQQKNKIVIFQ